jgi:hypothetical protein
MEFLNISKSSKIEPTGNRQDKMKKVIISKMHNGLLLRRFSTGNKMATNTLFFVQKIIPNLAAPLLKMNCKIYLCVIRKDKVGCISPLSFFYAP